MCFICQYVGSLLDDLSSLDPVEMVPVEALTHLLVEPAVVGDVVLRGLQQLEADVADGQVFVVRVPRGTLPVLVVLLYLLQGRFRCMDLFKRRR